MVRNTIATIRIPFEKRFCSLSIIKLQKCLVCILQTDWLTKILGEMLTLG